MIFTDKILAWFGMEMVLITDVIPDLVLSGAIFAVEVPSWMALHLCVSVLVFSARTEYLPMRTWYLQARAQS